MSPLAPAAIPRQSDVVICNTRRSRSPLPRLSSIVPLVLLLLGTGCGAILGFHDGKGGDGVEGDSCQPGVGAEGCANGFTCYRGACRSLASVCSDGGGGCEQSGGDPTTGTVATFRGEPGGLIAVNGFVYFTHDDGVFGCAGAQACPNPQVMYSNEINPHPRVITLDGSLVAWADPVAGQLSRCFFGMLDRCRTVRTDSQPGLQAMTVDPALGELYVVAGGAGAKGKESELRQITDRNGGAATVVATLPSTSQAVAIASDGPQRKFVQIGRAAYSVFTPTGADAGPSLVNMLAGEDPALAPPATAAIMVVGRRVVWTRPADRGGGFSQCAILDGSKACDPSSVTLFAGANDEITAAAATNNTVVWARTAGAESEVYFCKPYLADTSAQACRPELLAKGLAGRISAIAIEPTSLGPNNPSRKLYFVRSESQTGNVFIERAQLP